MKTAARLAIACFACAAGWAGAVEAPSWPPPPNVEARMRELQLVIIDRDSTLAQREAAREELASLLKSPSGQTRGRTPDERPPRPARAAIEPFPSVISPAATRPAPVPAPGVAHVEVTEPPKRPLVVPQTGGIVLPSERFAVDPRTGAVLHGIPGGYVDPRTGQVVTR